MTVFKGTIQGSGTLGNGAGTYVTVTLSFIESLRGPVDPAGNGNFTYSANGSGSAIAHYPDGTTASYSIPINYTGPLITNINSFKQFVGDASGVGISLTGVPINSYFTSAQYLALNGSLPLGYYPGGAIPSHIRVSGTLQAYAGTVSIFGTDQMITRPPSGTTEMAFAVTRSGYVDSSDSVTWQVLGQTNTHALFPPLNAFAASSADFVGVVLPSGTVNFAPGQTSATITVPIAGQPALAATKEFTLQLFATSPGVRGSGSEAFGTIASATTLAAGEVRIAGTGTDVAELRFADAQSAAAALAIAETVNSAIFAGQVNALTISPLDSIPAPASGTSGALVMHSGGTIALPLSYTTFATDASQPVTVLGGPVDGQAVLAGDGGLAFNAGAGAGSVIATGGANLVSAYPGAGAQYVQLGSGDDTIVALNGSNTVSAGSGHNVLLLGSGNNIVTTDGSDLIAETGAGNATITAGSGDIAAFLAGGATELDAGTGQSTVVAGSGDFWTQVSSGSQVWLGSGNATVRSNAVHPAVGAVTMIGGTGAATIYPAGDNLVFAGTNLTTLIKNDSGSTTVVGGTGPMNISAYSDGLTVLSFADTTFIGSGLYGANTVAAFSGSLSVVNGGGVFLGGPAGHNIMSATWNAPAILIGGGDGDVLTAGEAFRFGPSVQDALVAGPGSETLSGGTGIAAFSFYAGPGADLMIAGNGPSQMLDGMGAATMVGGGGLDLFAFANGDAGAVTIQAFNPSLHYLSLPGFPAGEAEAALASATNSSGSESLLLSDGTHITFQGFTGLSAGSFL